MPKPPKRPRTRKQAAKSSKRGATARPSLQQAAPEAMAAAVGVPPISVLIAELLDAIARGSTTTGPGPAKPLPAGTVGTEIPINIQFLQRLIAAAATQDNPGQQLWVKDGSELLVLTGKVSVTLDDGLVLLTIPVSCDQAAGAIIQVPFAVGSKDQPAGLVFATEERPRGPEVIVDIWSEALIAFAWRLMLTVTARIAAQSGVDQDGTGLVPIALTANKESLALLPMAHHTFDRVRQ
jgi:hypothetical protein